MRLVTIDQLRRYAQIYEQDPDPQDPYKDIFPAKDNPHPDPFHLDSILPLPRLPGSHSDPTTNPPIPRILALRDFTVRDPYIKTILREKAFKRPDDRYHHDTGVFFAPASAISYIPRIPPQIRFPDPPHTNNYSPRPLPYTAPMIQDPQAQLDRAFIKDLQDPTHPINQFDPPKGYASTRHISRHINLPHGPDLLAEFINVHLILPNLAAGQNINPEHEADYRPTLISAAQAGALRTQHNSLLAPQHRDYIRILALLTLPANHPTQDIPQILSSKFKSLLFNYTYPHQYSKPIKLLKQSKHFRHLTTPEYAALRGEPTYFDERRTFTDPAKNSQYIPPAIQRVINRSWSPIFRDVILTFQNCITAEDYIFNVLPAIHGTPDNPAQRPIYFNPKLAESLAALTAADPLYSL